MGKVEQIRKFGQVEIDIEGITFVCRKLTLAVALEAVGTGAAGLVSGARSTSEVDPEKAAQIVKAYLKACMMSPALGDESDDAADVVGWGDLKGSGLSEALFMQLIDRSGLSELLLGFQKSSPAATA